MKRRRLIVRSLLHHGGMNLAVAAGVALATAVLVGSLGVGDSVHGTLRDLAAQRLGKTGAILFGGETFFQSDLAGRIAKHPAAPEVAPVLTLPAAAVTPQETARANRVNLLGVDGRFFRFAPGSTPIPPPEAGEVYLNRPLAERLGVGVGDDVLLLTARPSLLPRDVPLVPRSDSVIALRRRVTRILPAEQFGRFTLTSEQVAPLNAYVALEELGEAVDQPGRANLMLAGSAAASVDVAAVLHDALAHAWTLGDAGFEIRPLPSADAIELTSRAVFIDTPVISAARRAEPTATGLLTYFVNTLRCRDRAVPYSFVAAVGQGPGNAALNRQIGPALDAPDAIVINTWLAEQLQAAVGDELTLRYFVLGGEGLRENQATFRVSKILPMSGPAAAATLTPEYPGLSGVEDCNDWDQSLPIDLDRIRPADEEYWDTWRATPKAFIPLKTGQRLWANRFGRLTAIRFNDHRPPGEVAESIRWELTAGQVGLSVRDIRADARRAVSNAIDFRGLFVGLSFFLIASAVLLTAMLFIFGVQSRRGEVATLRAVGWRGRDIAILLLGEGGLVALIGVGVGVAGGVLFMKVMVAMLGSLWAGAIAGFPVNEHLSAGSVLIGGAATLLVSLAAMGAALWFEWRNTIRQGLSGPGRRVSRWMPKSGWLIFGVVSGAFILAISCAYLFEWSGPPLVALAVGGAVMLAYLTLNAWVIFSGGFRGGRKKFTFNTLRLRGPSLRAGRSLVAMLLLGVAVFLVVAIQNFRLDYSFDQLTEPDGPAGGFLLYAEGTLPLLVDPATPGGRKALGLAPLPEASIVPLRLREGDDASCLNLNRPQQPALLGVRPTDFQGRFRFVQPAGMTWSKALGPYEQEFIPAVTDVPTAKWGLGIDVGDTLTIHDANGRPHGLKLVATIASSIFQGRLLIAERDFEKLFPRRGGWQVVLVDADRKTLSRPPLEALFQRTADRGFVIQSTRERMERFTGVQNTYLSIFGVLGVLAILVGEGGFAIVLLRNLLERRGELAALWATGFTVARLRGLIVWEYACPLILAIMAGLLGGLMTAALSQAPATIRIFNVLGMGLILPGLLIIAAAVLGVRKRSLRRALRND